MAAQVAAVRYGVRSSTARLRRVAVRRPATGDFGAAGWRSPDVDLLRRQHDGVVDTLTALGVEVEVLEPAPGLVDACFVYDPVLVLGAGAVELRQRKPERAGESARLASDLDRLGIPVVARMAEVAPTATADGGDFCWLDTTTVLGGLSYRSDEAAHGMLRDLLGGDGLRLLSFDLPHDRGPAHVLHLMSVVSPVADDLAVVFEPLAPVRLLQVLAERGVRTVPVAPDEYDALASNVLAVAPGVVVMFDGAPGTAAALGRHGVEVHVVPAGEIAKGDGGPTCLTRPLWRAP